MSVSEEQKSDRSSKKIKIVRSEMDGDVFIGLIKMPDLKNKNPNSDNQEKALPLILGNNSNYSS